MEGGEEVLELDGLTFVWSRTKAKANRRKHGVTFEEDLSAAHDEHRLQIMGYSLFGRLLLVVHVEVQDETTIRIISARTLDPQERRRLEHE